MLKIQTTSAEVRRLAVYFRHELDADVLETYVTALQDIPLAALQAGAARAIRTRDFFPRVAELRRDVNASLDTSRTLERLAGQVREADEWRGRTVYCLACHDSGWEFLGDRPDGKANTVRKCACRATNPALQGDKRYVESRS